jgi:hypothetical protein
MSRIHWVVRGTGTPKDSDEVNRRKVCEYDGWVCDLDVMDAPSKLWYYTPLYPTLLYLSNFPALRSCHFFFLCLLTWSSVCTWRLGAYWIIVTRLGACLAKSRWRVCPTVVTLPRRSWVRWARCEQSCICCMHVGQNVWDSLRGRTCFLTGVCKNQFTSTYMCTETYKRECLHSCELSDGPNGMFTSPKCIQGRRVAALPSAK